MNASQFLEGLVASYPPQVRPDAEYVKQIASYLKRKHYSSQELEDAYEIIRTSFRMFPSLADIQTCFQSAARTIQANAAPETAYDYFSLEGIQYRRKLMIDATGQVIRRPIPEGAEDYHLQVPDRMRQDRDFISAEQAAALGYIDKNFAMSLSKNAEVQMRKRFSTIKQNLEKADFGPSRPTKEDEAIDDSMAANPEEPIDLDGFDI
ncbi:MAG: hypothetical protein WC343_12800 [Bacilli bacterium]|jgi:hypothetical protein